MLHLGLPGLGIGVIVPSFHSNGNISCVNESLIRAPNSKVNIFKTLRNSLLFKDGKPLGFVRSRFFTYFFTIFSSITCNRKRSDGNF